MRRWTAALALTVVSPLAAQLREVRPTHTAVAFGWSDITGYGTALALLHRLPHAPVGLRVRRRRHDRWRNPGRSWRRHNVALPHGLGVLSAPSPRGNHPARTTTMIPRTPPKGLCP